MPVPCERRSLVSAGPLGRWIGWRDELWYNVAGGAPRRIVEGRQIFLHRAAGPRRSAIPAPILPRDRALLVGICLNQARIDCKALAADQTGRDARLDDPLEHVAENISIAEALVAGALIEASGSAWLSSERDAESVSRGLAHFGVIVIDESNGMGAGVRLKFTRQDVKQIGRRLEGEGGVVRSDDAP